MLKNTLFSSVTLTFTVICVFLVIVRRCRGLAFSLRPISKSPSSNLGNTNTLVCTIVFYLYFSVAAITGNKQRFTFLCCWSRLSKL